MGKKQQKQSQTGIWVVVGAAVAAVGVLIAVSLFTATGPETAPVKGTDATAGGERNVRGKATAKVTLTEYGDFL